MKLRFYIANILRFVALTQNKFEDGYVLLGIGMKLRFYIAKILRFVALTQNKFEYGFSFENSFSFTSQYKT